MIPYQLNSKNPKRSTPLLTATAFTIRLVEVPISVQLPPIIPANETGNSNFELGMSYFSASSSIIFTKTKTTAVVFIKAEILPAINIKTGIIISRGRPFNFLIPWARRSITPLSSSPIAMIIRQSTVIVAGLEKPEIASSGETRSVSNSRPRIVNAILSTGNISSANKKITPRMITKRRMISRLISMIKFDKCSILSDPLLGFEKYL